MNGSRSVQGDSTRKEVWGVQLLAASLNLVSLCCKLGTHKYVYVGVRRHMLRAKRLRSLNNDSAHILIVRQTTYLHTDTTVSINFGQKDLSDSSGAASFKNFLRRSSSDRLNQAAVGSDPRIKGALPNRRRLCPQSA